MKSKLILTIFYCVFLLVLCFGSIFSDSFISTTFSFQQTPSGGSVPWNPPNGTNQQTNVSLISINPKTYLLEFSNFGINIPGKTKFCFK